MRLQTGKPYRPPPPQTLSLSGEDFGFSLSATNEQALGRIAECSVRAYLARIIHVGWVKVAQDVGGPSLKERTVSRGFSRISF
jgi:hypothetical protein